MGSSGWSGSVLVAAAAGLASALLLLILLALIASSSTLPTSPTAGAVLGLMLLLIVVAVVGLVLGLLPTLVWALCMWTFAEWARARRDSWIQLCALGVGCSVPAALCFAILEPSSMGGATIDLRFSGGLATLFGGGIAGLVLGGLIRAEHRL
jgi:uncharacterized membrane-anchored protein